MSYTEILVVYVIIWWLVLFMVLPFGITRVDPATLLAGQDPGSPAKGRMLLKLGITSGISAVIVCIYYFVTITGLISLKDI
jgi:predicted secreted protein